jgi:hypothetical protein
MISFPPWPEQHDSLTAQPNLVPGQKLIYCLIAEPLTNTEPLSPDGRLDVPNMSEDPLDPATMLKFHVPLEEPWKNKLRQVVGPLASVAFRVALPLAFAFRV